MDYSLIETKIIRKLQELEEAQQLQVLDFTESLVQKKNLAFQEKACYILQALYQKKN